MVFLENSIIRLRALEPADIDPLYRWENDSRYWGNSDTSAPFSRKILADYIASASADIYADKQLRLIIELKEGGEAIGAVDLYDFDARNGRAGVGIMIEESMTGRGYATEALQLLAEYAAGHLGIHQLWAVIADDNHDSLALFERCGYRRAGRLQSWLRRGRGYTDAYIFQRFLTNVVLSSDLPF